MIGKRLVITLFVLGLMSFTSNAQAEWNFGIGTGPQFLAVKGDVGMNTVVAPIQLDIDFSFSDIANATDSVFGFGGYATNKKWMIQYKLGKLKLEDDAERGFGNGVTISAKAKFDVTEGELTVGYPVFSNSSLMIRGYGGLRYLRHEFDLVITGTGFNTTVQRNKSIDESWTDILLGISADVPFAQKWNWNVKADAGFGGSNGTYLASTGITWRFYGGWSATAAASYKAVDYENGSRGTTDWYMYDVDETTLGLTILYNW
jgi:hypothetical protein